jgi:beta-galactosidase
MTFNKSAVSIALLVMVHAIADVQGATAAPALAQRRSSIDPGWRFMLGDPANAQNPGLDDSSWTAVNLPHDWSIYGPFDRNAPAGGGGGYLPTGIGWYRKPFQTPDTTRNQRVKVEFDGIYENSEVWINGNSLGRRPFGYASFVYDLTPYLNATGQTNVLAVRVDNSPQPNSRWYSGSGIYRHTWLLITDDLHIPQWGTYVTTPKAAADSASVDVVTNVANEGTSKRQFELAYSVLDETGHAVAATSGAGQVDAGVSGEFKQSMAIPKPTLWSSDKPYLYTLRCAVMNGANVVDQYDTPFGVRTAIFDVNKGFLLNGTRVKLNGVCLHADGGGVGAAVPEGVWARRLQLLKEMGCNAIRTSHNPPDPEFLDLCDRMGFLVMDEAFDEWTIGKRQNAYHLHFKQWWQRDLTDFIHRDRNHPSIVLWSAGNEIGEQGEERGIGVLKGLVDTFHSEDPTRPVTAACDGVYSEPTSALPDFLSLLDVVGYNYVDRWRDRAEKYYSIDRQDYPNRRFVGTESISMAGIRGDYSWLLDRAATQPAEHSKDLRTPLTNKRLDVEQLWKFVSTNDYVVGDFMWTGIDYLGESSWPNKLAPSGTLDSCGFKKDSYYFYQSQWTSAPVLHIMPHWNLKGHEGEIIPVTCYTNCDVVELFLNGKSYGVKGYDFPRSGMEKHYGTYPPRTFLARTTSDLHLEWDVPYEPGILKAVGYFKDGYITQEVATTGDPAAIRLSVDKSVILANGGDVIHLTAEVVDAEGRVVPTADNDVSFKFTGPVRVLCVENGNPKSGESFQADHRRAFNGMCLAILQSTQESGSIKATAFSNGLVDASVDLTTQPDGK